MSLQRIATFAPNDVTIVVSQESSGLSWIMSGFMEDKIISIERNAETYTLYTGADNTNTRIFNANTSAKLTVALAQTSETNDVLTRLYQEDADSRDSSGIFSISVVDNSGRSSYFSEEAYIAVVPNAEYGNSMQAREWVIHATRMDAVVGGNSKFTITGAAAVTALGGTVAPRWA